MDVKAVFVDAAGTLLRPREPVGITYARHARHFGYEADPVEVETRFGKTFAAVRATQQRGDGRVFWGEVVAGSVGVRDEALFDALYEHYSRPRAWWIDVEALRVLSMLARSGVRLGIISNWDTRLRTLYERFALERMFPVLACSAEIDAEKPDPVLFHAACRAAGVAPANAVHVGNDPIQDVEGASRAGLVGLLYDEEIGWSAIGEQIKVLRRGVGMFGR